jgi:hypothetical protein
LQVDDLFLPGEPVLIQARMSDGGTLPEGLVAEVSQCGGAPREYRFRDGTVGWELILEDVPPGLHRIRVRGVHGGATAPAPVREVFEVAKF